MKIGVYNRYWNTLGGGEKHAGAIAQFLSQYGIVDLIGHEDFSVADIENRLNLSLANCRKVLVSGSCESVIENMSAEYDLWVNSCYLSSVNSRAKKSILLVFFPFKGSRFLQLLWRIYPVLFPQWFENMLWRKRGFWNSYDLVFANSFYTKGWISKWWGIESEVLTPPVDLFSFVPTHKKKKIILSVGRFFVGGHSKQQDIMIKAFIELYRSGECQDWEYHLCGGTHPEPRHQSYLEKLKEMAEGYPVFIHTDISRAKLEDLYAEAAIFWHATGFGRSELRCPEKFEHFGITTIEAMSAGCIPVVINQAGQKEIVQHGVNGFLWQSLDELKKFTSQIIKEDCNYSISEQCSNNAYEYSTSKFNHRLLLMLNKYVL